MPDTQKPTRDVRMFTNLEGAPTRWARIEIEDDRPEHLEEAERFLIDTAAHLRKRQRGDLERLPYLIPHADGSDFSVEVAAGLLVLALGPHTETIEAGKPPLGEEAAERLTTVHTLVGNFLLAQRLFQAPEEARILSKGRTSLDVQEAGGGIEARIYVDDGGDPAMREDLREQLRFYRRALQVYALRNYGSMTESPNQDPTTSEVSR